MPGIPERYSWLFWETDVDSIDPVRHQSHVLPRVLEFGGIEEVRWAMAT